MHLPVSLSTTLKKSELISWPQIMTHFSSTLNSITPKAAKVELQKAVTSHFQSVSVVDPASSHFSHFQAAQAETFSDYPTNRMLVRSDWMTTWPIRIKDFPARDGAIRQRNFLVFSTVFHLSHMTMEKCPLTTKTEEALVLKCYNLMSW